MNSYVTFVAARVGGQVARVLVDDNNRVKRGDVLVEIDPEPYQVQVAAFPYIPPQLHGAAVGLLALLRNEGGSVGTSVAKTIHDRREIVC